MSEEINPPGLGLRMLEGRAGVEAAQVMMFLPVLRMQARRGQGETVWVLPGFMADDTSTILLRQYLGSIGYTPHPWQQGINRRPLLDLLPVLAERLRAG